MLEIKPSPLDELETLDLSLPSKEGKAPESRLKSAETVRMLHKQNVDDDRISALRRAQVQAMVDGEAPYNQSALNASGQGSRANANFLEGRSRINRANNGYLDMVTSVKHLMTLTLEYGDDAERMRYTRILSEELTRTIRKWPSFFPSFMRLVDLFNTHGIGIAYFDDSRDFRFKACGFGDFLIPRQTPASEECIEYATARKDMTVTELYEKIRDKEKAVQLGWNPDAVMEAIARATTQNQSPTFSDIERAQQEVKNNDFVAGRKYKHVKIICSWVREFDGSITYALTELDNPGDFLFRANSKFENPDQAFVFFTYGIGNGTYHSIRGLGHLIFAQVQLRNRLLCSAADNAQMAMSTLIESEAANALADMAITQVGPFTVMPRSFTLVESRNLPDLTKSAVPILSEMRQHLDENSSQFMAPGSKGVYENRASVNAQLEGFSGGDSGNIDLFYACLDRLFREMVRRLVKGPKSDRLIKELHQRLERRGVTKEILDSIDHDNTYAFRAYGAGSPATRALINERMIQWLPNLDPIGQKRVIHQVVADIMGFQNADYYAPEPEEPRLPIDSKIAEIENHHLMQGVPMQVNPQDIHAAHVAVHVPFIIQTLEAVETGELDPMQNLPGLQQLLNHVAAHGEALATDPAQLDTYKQVREAVNNIGQVVTNMERKLRAAERQQREMGANGDTEAPDAQAAMQQQMAELKLAEQQFKFDLAQRLGELKLAEAQAKSQQNIALGDIRAAEQIRKTAAFPRSDYAMRR